MVNTATATVIPSTSSGVVSALATPLPTTNPAPAVSSALFTAAPSTTAASASTTSNGTLGRGALFASSTQSSGQSGATDLALADDETWALAGLVI